MTWQQWVALVGGAALVVFKDQRQQFASLGESVGATFMYLRLAEGQPQATAGLVDLVEVASKRHPGSNISIVAYSFGSLVAIDSLFPKSGAAPVVMQRVVCLVTIGTPFDFVRAVQPDWTMGRSPAGTQLRAWVNIFSTIDLLGSNFRNTIGTEAELSVATSQRASTSSITVHRSTGQTDVFQEVVTRIFDGTPLLS